MKSTYYHPESVTKINGTTLTNNILTIGSQIKEKIYSYYGDSGIRSDETAVEAYDALVLDYDNLILLIQSLYTASGITDPLRSIFGSYYVNDRGSIYLYDSDQDPTDIDIYPFPFKDLFTLNIISSENNNESNQISTVEQFQINIDNAKLYTFLSKYIFSDINDTNTLNLLTNLFLYLFKDALNKLLTGPYDYTKFNVESHSEKNIASKNFNYLSYNLISEYNQYIREYETYFSSSFRNENAIPNYYATDLYLNDINQNFAKNVITLNGRVDANKQTLLSNDYYLDFVNTLSGLSNEEKLTLQNVRNVILDDELSNTENCTLSSENFPYNIDLKFTNFSSDEILLALEKRKLNILATNNFYSNTINTSSINFYVKSETTEKVLTDDPNAYVDVDGETYYLKTTTITTSSSINGLPYNQAMNFGSSGSFSFYSKPNLNLLLTDKTRKIYESNKNSLSLFEYLKLENVMNSSIKPKLTINSILNNSLMNSTPIAFEIQKKSNNNTIQTTIIPRNSKISELSYKDTQVIYDKLYKYDIGILNLVEQIKYNYASTFIDVKTIFATPDFITGEDLSLASSDAEVPTTTETTTTTQLDFSQVNVPITVICATNENYFFYKNTLFTDLAIVVDDPPTPINVNIVPYIGVPNQLLFILNAQDTTIKDRPVLISESDRQYFVKVRHKQRPDNKEILFQSVSDISFVQIFRTLQRPKTYKDFSNSLYSTVSFNNNLATSFLETLQQNTKYYYTFRSVDVHGNISNPSDIFEVKIINNDGAIYPIITPYNFEQNQKMNMEKSFKKYLTIDPAIVQQQLVIDENGNPQLGIDNGFWNQGFKIRVTSKESGKAFDININFTKKIINTI